MCIGGWILALCNIRVIGLFASSDSQNQFDGSVLLRISVVGASVLLTLKTQPIVLNLTDGPTSWELHCLFDLRKCLPNGPNLFICLGHSRTAGESPKREGQDVEVRCKCTGAGIHSILLIRRISHLKLVPRSRAETQYAGLHLDTCAICTSTCFCSPTRLDFHSSL